MTKTIKRISDITEKPKREKGVANTIYTPPKINASFEYIFIIKTPFISINFHLLMQVVLTIPNDIRPTQKLRKSDDGTGISTSTCLRS